MGLKCVCLTRQKRDLTFAVLVSFANQLISFLYPGVSVFTGVLPKLTEESVKQHNRTQLPIFTMDPNILSAETDDSTGQSFFCEEREAGQPSPSAYPDDHIVPDHSGGVLVVGNSLPDVDGGIPNGTASGPEECGGTEVSGDSNKAPRKSTKKRGRKRGTAKKTSRNLHAEVGGTGLGENGANVKDGVKEAGLNVKAHHLQVGGPFYLIEFLMTLPDSCFRGATGA